MLPAHTKRPSSSSSSSPSHSPSTSAPASPVTGRHRAIKAEPIHVVIPTASPLLPITAILLSTEQVGDDAQGEAWKATVKGLPSEVVAQRLEIHDDEEEAFCEELQKSISELAGTGLLPVVGAAKETSNADEGTVSYLLLSKKCDMTADQMLKQKKDEPPSLDVRIGWALSIAQALRLLYSSSENYFHGQVNLRHVHLDLKTQEALLSCWAFRSYRAGRRSRPTLSDYYWKAPEVLVKEKRGSLSHDETSSDAYSLDTLDTQAADVYSFGILLWELCSLKQAFTSDYKSLGALLEGVSVRRHRPAIPEEWSESLGALAQSCWDGAVEARPRFDEVAGRLQEILLEARIPDPLGQEFWGTRFVGKEEVEFSVFQPAFYEFLGIPEPKKNDVKCNCLHAILKELDEQNRDVVTVKTFSDMTQWFGPLEKGWRVIDRINELLAKAWFFGRISGKDAEEAVCKADKGAFLFRFSTSKPGSYAITVHSRRGGAKHFRVYHEPGLNYLIGKTECKSLDEIIFKFKTDLNLLSPCPGSPFLELFRQDNFLKARYDSWETEDDDQDADLW